MLLFYDDDSHAWTFSGTLRNTSVTPDDPLDDYDAEKLFYGIRGMAEGAGGGQAYVMWARLRSGEEILAPVMYEEENCAIVFVPRDFAKTTMDAAFPISVPVAEIRALEILDESRDWNLIFPRNNENDADTD